MGKYQASSSSSSGNGLSGLGSLSHAYIQYPPLRCDIPGAAGVMYDDGNKLLLVPSPSKVYSWPVNQQPSDDRPTITPIKEGPVLGVRFSLDGKILAVQRSHHEVEFINKETGMVFRQQCKPGTERILGLFWTDCPTCDLVLVTSSGLELYSLYLGRNGLKLLEAKRSNVSWYVYTHESRLVLLASGMQCKTLSGYQFSAGGIVRLPKFDVLMTKAEVNRKPVLAPEDIRIATMYGRLYCLQVDRVAMQLNLYRFYRDAVVPQELMRTWPALLLIYCLGSYVSCCMETLSLQQEGCLPIYSRNVALSVVDNVLLIHEIDSKVVLLYDILSEPKSTISAPLPLLLRGAPLHGSSSRGFETANTSGNTSSEPDLLGNLTSAEDQIYDKGWVFVNPDIVLDHVHGLLWKIRLDLEAIAASSSDIPSLLSFLQRRRHEASKAKMLSIEVIRSMIIERQPLPLIASAMDVLTSSYVRLSKPLNAYDRTASERVAQTVPRPSTHHQGSQGSQVSSAPVRRGPDDDVVSRVVEGFVENGKDVSTTAHGDEEPSTSRWTQGSSDQDDQDSDYVSSRVDEPCANTPAADGFKHTNLRDISKMPSRRPSTGEIESSSSTYQANNPPMARESGRQVRQQSQKEISVVDPLAAMRDATSPLISPEEMQQNVFNVIEEEMTVDSTFLVAAILEYMRSAAAEQIKVNSGLHVLLIQLLAQEQRYYELWQLVIGKVLPPSRPVAIQLLETGAQHESTRKLGMDMLRQIHGHTEYIKELLLEGRILEGLRYVRQNKVDSVAPASFLEAAISSNDPQMLASVFRFCLDFVPNFSHTPDFTMYSSIVSQQCSTSA
ncbi:regulator of MON1-CCZ1 complex [Marchantia polymorpha subsp. ruderalis]|uniref:Mic1 domain-containing protein n=2 Tax=Marchantia polymorpha TaxID=3197 RepID=A0AAF6ALF6_MARPO|nr:hypothetical protein MARPO_0005s0167 [Marchantia polymorpha]BBM97276.1 hypothetical protein Mp_1g04400 [Marchantia polymorpha subsp. ruderalis]|eukprot:PTQ48530.1 hypothetical protein MARPO_0005s0167 [Marchantia polymorpha]